jgi:hypothetical protein
MEHMQCAWPASRKSPGKAMDEDAHVPAHVIEVSVPVLVFCSLPEATLAVEIDIQPETNFVLAIGTVAFADLSQQSPSSQRTHFSNSDIPGPLGKVEILNINKQAMGPS